MPAELLPKWDLSDLYPAYDAPQLQNDLKDVEGRARDFQATYEKRIVKVLQDADGAETLYQAITAYESLEDKIGAISSYAGLLYASDMTDPNITKFQADIRDFVTGVTSNLLFFTVELNEIDDKLFEQAISSEPLAHYAPWLKTVRTFKPHQLGQDLERLFHEKEVTGRASWVRLFDETFAHLSVKVAGKECQIEEALHLLSDPDATARKNAAHALSEVFSDNIRTFTLITNVLARDKEIEDEWRAFGTPDASRHLSNQVEADVVEALTSSVYEWMPRLSHRYYALKARWFGKDQLDYWDRNAPLPDEADTSIPWQEAQRTVLTAYEDFSPSMAEIAGRFFDKRWIDAGVRPGKAPGAFSHPTVPSAHPYILLNYQDKIRDVMTLAHELGHGVHQVLAADQGALMAPTPLTLAETASVFGEMLTFRSLLSQAPSKRARRHLLASKVEDMLNTVVRQIAFYRFEQRVHQARRNGELASEAIGDIWLDVQRESLGPAIRLNDGYETYWCYIPHFIHSPFYVYAYAFGDCLVNSLYAVYEESHQGFAERYLEMLKAGGTLRHKEMLAPFGLDAGDPAFWGRGLSLIEQLIEQLEEVSD